YYADGQAYQEKINLQNQAIATDHQIQVKSIANNQFILVQLPTGCDSASVQFFRPSNAAQDKTVKWNSNNDLNWTFPTGFLVAGPWKRSISWSVAGKNYLQEDRIFISKK
ncbi:MAG: FixH family protein, partial [Aquirufa sp.]